MIESCIILLDEEFVTINCDSVLNDGIIKFFRFGDSEVVFEKDLKDKNYFRYKHYLKKGIYNIVLRTEKKTINKRINI